MRATLKAAAAVLALPLLFCSFAPAAKAERATLRCESVDYQRAECALDTGRWRVEFGREISRGRRCAFPNSWGVGPNGVWVDRGCRADFALIERRRGVERHREFHRGRGYRPERRGRGLICESVNWRRRNCPVDLAGRSVALIEVLGRERCVLGRSWGVYMGGIWVENNCVGRFRVFHDGRGVVGSR